jgi:hypothetical protein
VQEKEPGEEEEEKKEQYGLMKKMTEYETIP